MKNITVTRRNTMSKAREQVGKAAKASRRKKKVQATKRRVARDTKERVAKKAVPQPTPDLAAEAKVDTDLEAAQNVTPPGAEPINTGEGALGEKGPEPGDTTE